MPRLQYQIDALIIHQIRKGASLTQEEFAAKLKVSLNAVQKWEQGRATPRPKNLRILLKLSQKISGFGIDHLVMQNDQKNLQ